MYDAGTGVVRDHFHACSLYASAGESPDSPFAPLARDIAQIIREPLTSASIAAQTCVPTNAMPWGEAAPTTFRLGPNHWVRLDAGGTTVRFEGVERRYPGSFAGPGIVWLPSQYTPVDVMGPAPMRRHFIQSFVWH